MENTIQNKEKFFALYFGQKVMRTPCASLLTLRQWGSSWANPEHYLELTPLSLISDEDAIEVAQIETNFKWNLDLGTKVIIEDNQIRVYYDAYGLPNGNYVGYKSCTTIFDDFYCSIFTGEPIKMLSGDSYDYLRSKGYYIGDGTEIEYGWVKLKTK